MTYEGYFEKTTTFSCEPYEPLIIEICGESFDLRSTTAFVQWHKARPETDFYGIRLASGRFVDLRIVTETPIDALHAAKTGFYMVRLISHDEANLLGEIWKLDQIGEKGKIA